MSQALEACSLRLPAWSRRILSLRQNVAGQSVTSYEGSGPALLPVLEEATSDGATLVLVFILTVIVTDPRTVVVRVENYPYHLDLTFSQRHYCSGISSTTTKYVLSIPLPYTIF